MKKIVFLISLCVIQSTFAKNMLVDKDFVENVVKKPLVSIQVQPLKGLAALISMKRYFGESKFKVIASYPLGYGGTNVYFAVEEYMPEKYYNAIKRGIIVKENGELEAYLDTEKGVYNEKRKIVDFEKIGIRKGEIKCFIIPHTKLVFENVDYFIPSLDQDDLNIQSNWSASVAFLTISLSKQRSPKEPIVFEMSGGSETEKDLLELKMDRIQDYRTSKAKETALKSAAVKEEFERLKKEGLVEE